MLDESGIVGSECPMKVRHRRKVAGAIRPLVSSRSFQLECARVLHEALLMLVLF